MNDATLFDGAEADSSGPDGTGFRIWHHQVADSPVYTDALFRLFFECVRVASHKDCVANIPAGRGVIRQKLKRGQAIFGRKRWAERLGIAESTLNDRMQKLVANKSIVIEANSNYSIVTVINFEAYQDIRRACRQPKEDERQQASDTLPTGHQQVTDTSEDSRRPLEDFRDVSGQTPEDVLSAWNQTAGTKRARELNAKRRAAARTRLAEPSWEWQAALAKFPLRLCVSDPGGWQPDFDWFLRPGSVTAILEGKYDWEKTNGHRPQSASPARIRSGEYSDQSRFAETSARA